MSKFWTTTEIKLLKSNYREKGAEWIKQQLPHRSSDAIYAKVRELKLSRNWTEDEEEILKRVYPKRGTRGLVSVLGRDTGTIRNKAMRMGLRYDGYHERNWSESEIDTIISEYPSGGIPVLKKLLPKRSQSAIYMMARDLGLKSVHGRGRRSVDKRQAA